MSSTDKNQATRPGLEKLKEIWFLQSSMIKREKLFQE